MEMRLCRCVKHLRTGAYDAPFRRRKNGKHHTSQHEFVAIGA